jgi:hypothetical protein
MVYSDKPRRDLAMELGIPFQHNELTAFTDASYACEHDTGRSRGGYVIMWNGAAISWKSLIFKTVAISAAEVADIFTTARGNPQMEHATHVLRGSRPSK